MPQFTANGAAIHYETVGAGPPLLLIAGIASDSASWRPLVPLLAPTFSLILIDNRGSGQTIAEGPLSVDDMVADCAALLDHLGIAETDVLGHSLGGLIGLRLAAQRPDRVRRLVTMTSGVILASNRVLFHDMARIAFTTAPNDWFRLLYQWLFSEPFFTEETNVAAAAVASASYPFRQSPGDFARQVAAIDRLEAIDLSAVRCPVLALSAELDRLVPASAVDELHEAVPNLTRASIAGAAHSLHWEQPDAVAVAVREFLGVPDTHL